MRLKEFYSAPVSVSLKFQRGLHRTQTKMFTTPTMVQTCVVTTRQPYPTSGKWFVFGKSIPLWKKKQSSRFAILVGALGRLLILYLLYFEN